MPTFDTPEPITATIDLAVGDVRITASDRGDTVVDVRPSDPSNDEDVKAAEQTRVEYANEQLLVKAPKLRVLAAAERGGSIDVTIELPAGSHVARRARARRTSTATASSASAGSRPASAASGSTRPARSTCSSGAGDISVDRATGHAEVTTGSGDVRLRELDGSAVIKNSNGDTWIGAAGGDLRRQRRQRRHRRRRWRSASVGAKSANGDVRIGEVVRGSVVLETARRPRGRHPRGHRRLARRELAASARAQRARGRRRPRDVGRDRRGARPHVRRRHRDPASLTSDQPQIPRRIHDTPHQRSRPPACASPSATTSCSTASTWTSPRERSSRCSAPTAPARPPWSRSSRR